MCLTRDADERGRLAPVFRPRRLQDAEAIFGEREDAREIGLYWDLQYLWAMWLPPQHGSSSKQASQ